MSLTNPAPSKASVSSKTNGYVYAISLLAVTVGIPKFGKRGGTVSKGKIFLK